MIEGKKTLFRWGPIPGYLINVDAWLSIFLDYPSRPHHYHWPEGYMAFHDRKMFYLNELAPLEKTGSDIFRKEILTSRKKKFVGLWQKCVTELFNFCAALYPEKLHTMTDPELFHAWKLLNKLLFNFWEPGIIPEMAAYGAEAILKEELAKEGLDNHKRMLALSFLSAPMWPSFYQEEEIALLKVAGQYGKMDFQKLLLRHLQRYFWIGNSYGAVKVMPESFFVRRIKGLLRKKQSPARQIEEVYSHMALAKKNHQQALKWVKRKALIKRISDGLVDCIWWQDQRKGHIFHYLHYLDLFVREFARRCHLPHELLHMAWHREINLKPKASLIKKWKSRRRLYVTEFSKKGFRELSHHASQDFYRNYWTTPAPTNRKEFAGMIVYPSPKPVIGRAFIVRHHADLARFPAGSIMVTTMTAPEYVTAIRKARAIIADEGGLTCHAAIVSRELKVPCIVGTKVATRVLKNGDQVEVDTNKGSVRKL